MKDRLNVSEMWDKCPTMIRGIYFIYNSIGDIIYIGKSKNCVRQRLNSHLLQKPTENLSKNQLIKLNNMRNEAEYFSFLETKNQDVKEVRLIKKHKPKFNIQHL